MLKRFCDVCKKEIPDSKLYFELSIMRKNLPLTAVDESDEKYAKPFLFNRAQLCGNCFSDIFLYGKYPSKAYDDRFYTGGENE